MSLGSLAARTLFTKRDGFRRLALPVKLWPAGATWKWRSRDAGLTSALGNCFLVFCASFLRLLRCQSIGRCECYACRDEVVERDIGEAEIISDLARRGFVVVVESDPEPT